jgi:hypothetical protein
MEDRVCSVLLVTTMRRCARIVEKSSVELKKIDNKRVTIGFHSAYETALYEVVGDVLISLTWRQ